MKTELPRKIRSISNPRWTDELRWVPLADGGVADVDHDWRIWTKDSGHSYVRHKGETSVKSFDTLALALASLDYEVDS